MNIKTFFISASLSLLFGIYSIYGLITYLEKSEKHYKDEIHNLKKTITVINKKYDETNKKYGILLLELEKTKDAIDILSKNITKLETNKIEIQNCINNESSLEDIMEDLIDNSKIICNAIISNPIISNAIIDISKLNLDLKDETNDIINDVINDIINNISQGVEEHNDHEFEILETDISNNEHIIKSRARGTSVSNINWAGAINKFIFG